MSNFRLSNPTLWKNVGVSIHTDIHVYTHIIYIYIFVGITVHFVCWSRLLICQQYFHHFACESLCEIIACWLKFHFVPNETFHSFNGSSSIIHPPNAHKHTYTHTHAYIYIYDWLNMCTHVCMCVYIYIYVSATIISLLNQSYPECLWWFKSPGHAWWRLLRHQPRRRRADALKWGRNQQRLGNVEEVEMYQLKLERCQLNSIYQPKLEIYQKSWKFYQQPWDNWGDFAQKQGESGYLSWATKKTRQVFRWFLETHGRSIRNDGWALGAVISPPQWFKMGRFLVELTQPLQFLIFAQPSNGCSSFPHSNCNFMGIPRHPTFFNTAITFQRRSLKGLSRWRAPREAALRPSTAMGQQGQQNSMQLTRWEDGETIEALDGWRDRCIAKMHTYLLHYRCVFAYIFIRVWMHVYMNVYNSAHVRTDTHLPGLVLSNCDVECIGRAKPLHYILIREE